MTHLVKKASLGLLVVSLLGAPAFAGNTEKSVKTHSDHQASDTGEVNNAQCEQVSGATSKPVSATPAATAEKSPSKSKSAQ